MTSNYEDYINYKNSFLVLLLYIPLTHPMVGLIWLGIKQALYAADAEVDLLNL